MNIERIINKICFTGFLISMIFNIDIIEYHYRFITLFLIIFFVFCIGYSGKDKMNENN